MQFSIQAGAKERISTILSNQFILNVNIVIVEFSIKLNMNHSVFGCNQITTVVQCNGAGIDWSHVGNTTGSGILNVLSNSGNTERFVAQVGHCGNSLDPEVIFSFEYSITI